MFIKNYKGFNVILIKKNIHSLNIKINKKEEILVTCPKRLTNKKVLLFFNKFVDKLISKYEASKSKRRIKEDKIFILNKSFRIDSIQDRKNFYELNGDTFGIHYTKILNKRKLIKKILLEIAEKETKEIFEKYLKLLNLENYGISLSFKWLKSVHGICNYKKRVVTLSLNLLTHDLKCVEYVIVHELAHFYYPNHSKNFWKLVEKYIPNWKVLRNKINLKD